MQISNGRSALRAAWVGLLLVLGAAPAQAALVGLRDAATGASTVAVSPSGGSVNLELFLDTEGLSFEGYYLGVDFSAGPLTIQSVTHQPLSGLFPDLFATTVIDNSALTIRGMTQNTFSTGLPAGVYLLDLINVQVGALAPGQEITATPGLFSEVLGLGGGACPGTVACTISYQSVQIAPEPTTALLLASGLLGLGLRRAGRGS